MSHTLIAWLWGAATLLIVVLIVFLAAWLEQWWRYRKDDRR